jgi:hypothetical protein
VAWLLHALFTYGNQLYNVARWLPNPDEIRLDRKERGLLRVKESRK